MAKKPLYKINEERTALMEIERCLKSIDLIKHTHGTGLVAPDVCCAIGKSLMQHIYSICEVVLHFICCEKATKNGLEEWPRMKDLLRKGNCVDALAEVRGSSVTIEAIKDSCEKTFVTPEDLETFFNAVLTFLKWATAMLRDEKAIYPIRYLEDFIGGWISCYEREKERPYDRGKFSLVYLGEGVDIDEMTDEELDRIYKRHKGNKRESLLPVFILQIFKDHSDINRRLHINDIKYYLEDEYEITAGRGAIERWIHTFLAADDFYLWEGPEQGSGYWYSEKDENANEEIDD